MKRFGIFLCVILLLMTSGCSQEDTLMIENEGPVWVITEQVSYDADGNEVHRSTYEYDDANHFRQNSYNEHGELIAYDIVTTNDEGKTTNRTSYDADGTELVVRTFTYREDGKQLSSSQKGAGYDITNSWQWNEDGTAADAYFSPAKGVKPNKVGTNEFDDQGRIVRSVMNGEETTYTYEEQKDIMCSVMGDGSRYIVVRYYDEQNRLTEVYDYRVNHEGDYTEDDLVNYTKQTYKEDGHSLTMESWTKDLATADKLTSTIEITYQPLNDVV